MPILTLVGQQMHTYKHIVPRAPAVSRVHYLLSMHVRNTVVPNDVYIVSAWELLTMAPAHAGISRPFLQCSFFSFFQLNSVFAFHLFYNVLSTSHWICREPCVICIYYTTYTDHATEKVCFLLTYII